MPRLKGSITDDTITGYNGRDIITGDYGDDQLAGANGRDRLDGGRGNDQLQAGDGNDVLLSRSDAGETAIAQEITAANDPNGEVDAATRMVLPNQAGLPANDVLTGGAGADTFRFETLLAAKRDILEKHADPNTGVIDYHAVAGENNLVHDHWVDSIGNDVITDFNAAEGDRIQIRGHTTEVSEIRIVDADGDGAVDDSVLQLRSNQGGGGGAHNLDLLGTVTVLNNELTANDFTVDASVHYGVVENISQVNESILPYNPGNTTPTPAPVDDPATGAGTGAGSGTGSGSGAGGSTGSGTGAGTGSGTGGGHSHGGTGTDAGAGTGSGSGTGTGSGSGAGGDPAAGGGTGSGGTGTGGGPASPASSIVDQMMQIPDGAAAGQAPTAGDDVVIYGEGDDNGNGGMGNDLVTGLAGDDSLSGGWGDDRIDGGTGDDHVHGNHGDDFIAGREGDDSLIGDFGSDILVGGEGSDQLRGSRGEDVLLGGADDDELSGGIGDDVLMGGAGNDQVRGGSGTDALLLEGAFADYTVAVDGNEVRFTDAAGATDVVTGVEQFRFLGNGETYAIDNGALALTTDTEGVDELLADHMLEDLIAQELAPGGAQAAAPPAANGGAGSAAAAAPVDAGDTAAVVPEPELLAA